MPSSFGMDLQGRLRNVPLAPYRALVPLFEAVMNSLDAIREHGRQAPGVIDIEIVRGGQQQELGVETGKPAGQLDGFRVRDDGIGFTDENYESFLTADTRKKLKLGGRGVGRLTWLKAFEQVHIRSVYADGNGKRWVREFPFTSEQGVAKNEPRQAKAGEPEGTEVRLERIKAGFLKQIPKTLRPIGDRVVDHFLVSLRPSVAKVTIYDGDESFDVTREVASILNTAARSKVVIQNETFNLTHVRITAPEVRNHRLAYLADGREVRSDSLASHLPQLKGRLVDGEGSTFWSLTMAESELLDRSVTFDRSAFSFPEEEDPLFADQWTLHKIRAAILPEIKAHLDQFLAPIRKRAQEEAQRFVEQQAPEYRSVLKFRPEAVADLPTELPAEKLDMELRKIAFRMELDQREEGQRLLASGVADPAAYDKYVSEINETAVSNLAKYVIQRRVILNLFRKALKTGADGKYELESAIHKIIFPLGKDSDEVPYEQTNLWIIDEKLAYHAYLASDKQLRTNKNVETESKQRPDLIVFNRAIAFVDREPPYESVVIVEFKRAARDDYRDNDNPINQVYRYVTDVREGKAKDHQGRPIQIGERVPFFAYVVCDITPKLKQMATFAQLRATWDGQGFFGFNESLGVYVEIVSFDKLVDDAERRNRVFFEKLRLK